MSEKELKYRLKPIYFFQRHLPIILQNENGPCPLIAICNILFLRGQIAPIHPDISYVSTQQLLEILSKYLRQQKPNLNKEMKANFEKNVKDALMILPSLQYGLDVNVKFNGEFEYTTQSLIFDLTNINLVHGWVVDPQDKETHTTLKNLSYNQIVEKLVSWNEQHPSATIPSPSLGHKNNNNNNNANMIAESISKLKLSTDTVPTSASSQPNEPPSDFETAIINRFLNQNASQLTYYGLAELHQKLKEGELCVFFRNNHFCTMLKHKGELYLLITDLGYLSEPDAVWEKLSEIDGDTQFYESNFSRYQRAPPPAQPAAVDGTFVLLPGNKPQQATASEHPAIDADFEIALKLQQQYTMEQQQSVGRPSRAGSERSDRKKEKKERRSSYDRHGEREEDPLCTLS